MAKSLNDAVTIMRLAIGRRNVNDPDSTPELLLNYINDFATLTMSDDVKLFEQWGTLKFNITIANTDGVYTFPDTSTSTTFVNTRIDGFISLKDPVDSSVSWNTLEIYQDPGEFYGYWGINNVDTLTAGFPTQMLYYGNEFVFRTIPNDTYTINIYGYKKNTELTGTDDLPNDYWVRYIAYGAAMDYANDYSIDPGRMANISRTFAKQRELLLTRTHNQIKGGRSYPRY